MMNEKWNQYFFGEPTEEEKRELFQELEKNEDMKRELNSFIISCKLVLSLTKVYGMD